MKTQKKRYDNLGLIVALGQNGEIGYQNDLIWRIKEDLQFFKNVTMDSYIIMGRNTYESMPKNLSGRKYIVLSHNEKFNLQPPKIVSRSISETLSLIAEEETSKFWVVGGGLIYNIFLPYISLMHITQIQDSFKKADTFFPEFNYEDWSCELGEVKHSENDLEYRHILLKKPKNNI